MPSAAAPYCLSLMLVSTFALSATSLLEACLPTVAYYTPPRSRHITLSHLWSTHSIMFHSSQSKGNAGWMNPPDSDDFIVYLTEITVAGGRKQRFPGGKGQVISSVLWKVTIASRASRRLSFHAYNNSAFRILTHHCLCAFGAWWLLASRGAVYIYGPSGPFSP